MSIVRLSAKLDRTDSGTSWGFRLAGGQDFGAPLVLQRVIPGSLAAKCGLQEGDTITKIGGFSVDHLRHKEAQQKIMDSGNSLELTLQRSGSSMGGNGTAVDNSMYSPSGPSRPYQPAFNAGPRPFPGGQVNNSVSSLTSQTSGLSIGSSYDSAPVSDQYSVPWARGGSGGSAGGPVGVGGSAPWKPQVPTGERHMKVGRAGEARSLPAAGGGSARVPMCSACGTYIRGPFISALDKTWCPDHFICANPTCRAPLLNIGFVEEEGKLYCEKDYEQFLAPKCGKCGRSIVGEVVNAMRNTYHMGCFVCVQCHQPIGTGSFHNEDGKIYCQKDWAQNFQTKCYGCQFPIEPGDRWVEALSNNWHSECFNCSTCQVNLEGQGFVAKQGKPYCKKHGAGNRF